MSDEITTPEAQDAPRGHKCRWCNRCQVCGVYEAHIHNRPMTPDPTPQPPDHGAAGFCTDHGRPADRPTIVTREAVEAAWAAWFPGTSGPWSTDFRWRLYKALADLGLTVTDTPTEEGAR